MTPACWRVLRWLAEPEADPDEPREIVADGIWAYMGTDRVHLSTVNRLLRLVAIREESDGGALRRWTINSVGRALLRRPELETEIGRALVAGGSWTVQDDRLVQI